MWVVFLFVYFKSVFIYWCLLVYRIWGKEILGCFKKNELDVGVGRVFFYGKFFDILRMLFMYTGIFF